MTAQIRELTKWRELVELGRLLSVIWGSESHMSPDILTAMAHSGSYIAGAFEGDRMIGGLVGWLGMRSGELLVHSHILGVLPGDQAHGLGFELKQHQRRWCLQREIHVMEWTTDPLVRRNAYFNLTKLGAEAPEYLVNFYGEMRDGINAGEESDRLLIRWRLDSEKAELAATGRAIELDAGKLRDWTDRAALSIDADGEPVAAPSSARVLICQVPDDIVAMRLTNPARARRWRLALRDSLGGAMARGYRVNGATKSGWYVLESASQ